MEKIGIDKIKIFKGTIEQVEKDYGIFFEDKILVQLYNGDAIMKIDVSPINEKEIILAVYYRLHIEQ